jgi:hypothetical protein
VCFSTARTSTKKFSNRWQPSFKEKVGQMLSMDIAPYGQCQTTLIKIEFDHNGRITPQTHCALPFSPDITLSDFFLFGWLKSEFASRPVTEINKLFHVMEIILGILTIGTVASFSPTGSKD